MVATIVESGDPDFLEMFDLNTAQGGGTIVYRRRDDTLWRVYNRGKTFIQVDYSEVDPVDPTGTWGKWRYLGKSLQEESEDPADFNWGQF